MNEQKNDQKFAIAFGVRVRALGEATPSRLSQEACAHAIGLALSSWNRMERGVSVPHASPLPAIAGVLEVDPNALFQDLS